MASSSAFIVQESGGTYALNGPPKCEPWPGLEKDEEEARFITTSPNGSYIAVGKSKSVAIFDVREGVQRTVINSRMLSATFSPCGSYLLEWNNPNQQHDNFNIWLVGTKKEVKVVHSLKLNKQPEALFSQDETIFARLSTNTIIFSKAPDFPVTERKTPDTLKVAKFSLSTTPQTPKEGPLFVLCYVPAGNTGQPSSARMFRYPNFESPVTSKSFFQADRVEMKWNKRGTAVLVITSTDVDKTGETAVVQTESDSAIIHAAEWSPNSIEFAIITGKMPQTRAALLNSKCQVIFDMEISARNAIYFNPQGNLLLLAGFGNLAHGKIEVWEVKTHKKLIATCTAPATTQLEWLSDGYHFITATTAPRMQVGNEFHIWNYQGKEVFKWQAGKHLFSIFPFKSSEQIMPFPEEDLDKFVKSLGGKPPIQKVEEQKKAAVYVPPSKRGLVGASPKGPQPLNSKVSSSQASQLNDNEKKARAIKKKLEQIEKIKQMIQSGQKVEKNQEEKLKTEEELIEQLKAFEIT